MAQPGPARKLVSDPSEEDLDRARALFAEGLSSVEQGDWVRAEACFREVLSIRESHVVAYNLASALEHLGRVVESAELLGAILSAEDVDSDTEEAARQLLSDVESRVGTLQVRVSGDVEGSVLELDGQPFEVIGDTLRMRVDPGEHRVTVERAGRVILSPRVAIGEGHPLHAQLVLEIPQVHEEPSPRLSPVSSSGSVDLQLSATTSQPRDEEPLLERWWVWAGAGAVVVGVVAIAVAASAGSTPQPVVGDTDPPLVRVRVAEMQ